jgi:hypothetical protein
MTPLEHARGFTSMILYLARQEFYFLGFTIATPIIADIAVA